jgi:hypothetical protein
LPLLSVCAAVAVTALVVPAPAARAEAPAAVGSPAEVENVRAFARLFGVVRFFYPGDASTEIDWGRFAVRGVAQTRSARDTRALTAALQSLVAPLGPGIVVGARLPEAATPGTGGPLVAWQYLGAGFSAMPGPYRARRTNRAATASIDGFVTVMRNVPAEALRGRAIRLRGEARVRASDESGTGALWLRVDRPNQAMGFFDNMQDRPIREAAWREYTIEGTVAEDAANVAFGVMASGAATADFDAIALSTRGADGTWAAVPLADDGFEAAADGGPPAGWFRAGTSREAIEKRVGDDPVEGRQCLRLAPGTAAGEALFDGALTAGDHVDVDLGSGLHARVPLTLGDAEARIGPAQRASLDALKAALAALPTPAGDPGPDLRLADVVVAWNVYRHFYPYWTEAGVDWDARLLGLLDTAARSTTRGAHTDALKALVAEVRDGHGFVAVPTDKPSAALPMRLALVEDRLVVTASAEPEVPVGAVLLQIDGVPAEKAIEKLLALSSGTLQWRRARTLREVGSGAPDSEARLRIDDGREVRELSVRRRAAEPPLERRPEPVTELEPGIFYVDLTRATGSQLDQALARLAGARGVVFDMRGYPTETGAQILPHLIDAPETDRWMHVARITGPFGRAAGWESAGWNLQPASPHLAGRRIFLTDGRAISYAESVMGYVGDRKLGTVVGSTTAGTNGNVATFDLPSGSRIGFTAMRVTGHDGRAPHHLVGVPPDVPAEPTVAGIRAGRDEVLERGLALARTP